MSERNLESYESRWPLVHVAIATLGAFTSVAILMWLLTLFIVVP